MRNKIFKVIISENAMKMLASHIRFLANVELKAAKKLHKEIISSAKSLKKLPERNPWLSDNVITANKYRKMVIANNFTHEFYTIKIRLIFML